MNAQQIRDANKKIEEETLKETALTSQPVDDDIELNKEFGFLFDEEGDITKSKVLKFDDEHLILKWCDFIREVDDWFVSLMSQAVIKAPTLVNGSLQEVTTSLPYLNQISDMRQLHYLHNKSKDLQMNNRADSTDFGTFMRLDDIIQLRNKVLSSHNFCLSTFKKFLTKIHIYNKDACYTHLYKDINNLISTGIFLRKYRDDLTKPQLELAESSNAELNKIIDFRDPQERSDYLDTERSIFVDNELNVAEKYLHVLIKAKQDAHQQLVNERDKKAQDAGRYLRSKKNKKVNKLSRK
jgi:hypothetical protein